MSLILGVVCSIDCLISSLYGANFTVITSQKRHSAQNEEKFIKSKTVDFSNSYAVSHHSNCNIRALSTVTVWMLFLSTLNLGVTEENFPSFRLEFIRADVNVQSV